MKFMYWKVVCIVCITIMVALYPSLGWGAFIMKTDGSVMNVSFDPQQTLVVKTDKDKKTLRLADIEWMAGEEVKRIRIASEQELITGKILDFNITIIADNGNLHMLHKDIIFLFKENIDIEKYRSLEIYEYGNNQSEARKYARNSPQEKFNITLMPNFWNRSVMISDAIYSSSITSTDEFKIDFYLTNLKQESIGFCNGIEKTSFYHNLKFEQTTGEVLVNRSRSVPLNIISSTDSLQYQSSINLGAFFYREGAYEVVGEGFIYSFIYKNNIREEILGDSNLLIFATVSNVIKLPINIIKSNIKKELFHYTPNSMGN